MRQPTNGLDLEDPSSFRDPSSTVLIRDEDVVRVFWTPEALHETTQALEAPFARKAVDDGSLLEARSAPPTDLPAKAIGALTSRRIPFVTDPREWSFEMRRDAALLTLRLSQDALKHGFEMKDASSFNVLFDGCRATFIDHGSFRGSYSGHWPGYSQFADHFMNPLLVEAHAGVPAHQAGFTVEGIPLGVAKATNRGSARLRRGSFTWISRRALAAAMSQRSGTKTGTQLASVSLPLKAVARMMDKARTRITALDSATPSFWRDYEESACPYEDAQTAKKRSVVDAWASSIDGRDAALDVGCNIGTFSEILADHFTRVIAVDNDSVAVDRLYRRGVQEPWGARVTPAVVDLAQPTPAIGWLNQERASFLSRVGIVDLSVWLAVLHHLMLTGGIPLPQILELVRRVSRWAIIEHIAPEDGSVTTMTAGRRWAHVPDLEEFRAELVKAGFRIEASETISPTRTLVRVQCPR